MTEKKQRGGSRPNTGGRREGSGRKRTGGLQPTGALAKLPPIWVDAETLQFLRSLPNLSEFMRLAINEKRGRG